MVGLLLTPRPALKLPRSVPSLAFRFLQRDIRSGRLATMLMATFVAVAATVSVALLVERVNQIMVAESSALLAGDLAISGATRQPAIRATAETYDLDTNETVALRSVVAAGEKLQLVRLKAVGSSYPLRGQLRISEQLNGRAEPSTSGPQRGEIWADPRFFHLTESAPGDRISIGAMAFKVSKVLIVEPDRGRDIFALAPRVLMHLDDLDATGLIVPGSRATYTTLVAGPAQKVADFKSQLTLGPNQRLQDPRESRPEIQSTFLQAERFLTLGAFTGVLLATIGIMLAANAYRERQRMAVAIMKTLGLTTGEITRTIGFELLLLALLAALFGNATAYVLHQALAARFLPDAALTATTLPLVPFVHGVWVAVVVLAAFAMPPLAQLARLPVTNILARPATESRHSNLGLAAAAVIGLLLVAPWHLSNSKLIALTLSGMCITALLAALVSYGLVRILRHFGRNASISWRFGIANIARRGVLSVTQCTALGLGIAVVLLLGIVREDLFEQWQERIPEGTPNQFLINIQPDEVDQLSAFLDSVTGLNTRLYPMVRGRLSYINDVAVEAESFQDPRARRLAAREHNLSSARTAKSDNRVVAGKWWLGDGREQWSVERGLADALGIQLHDRLTFDVASRPVSGVVTNIREVDWGNFQVNFFVVGTPELLEGQPTTFITSFYLDPRETHAMSELVRTFPSVTVIDVEAVMFQVRLVMARVSGALTWVFGFALVAAVLVLVAAIQASQRARVLDVVLLKTLGASKRFVTVAVVTEFVILGALAGALGSLGALATGWALAVGVFRIPYVINASIAGWGVGAGIVLVSCIGLAATLDTHRHAVVDGLRRLR